MKHFLVVYNRGAGELVTFREYTDYRAAMAERFRLERTRTHPDQEIVVLTSESRENLERTHSRYFKSASDLLRSLSDHLGTLSPA